MLEAGLVGIRETSGVISGPCVLRESETGAQQLWVHFYLLSHARGKRTPSRISNKRLKADFPSLDPSLWPRSYEHASQQKTGQEKTGNRKNQATQSKI